MQIKTDEKEGHLWLRLPLDAETARRLASLADVCHAAPESVAASLLHDILQDDDEAHELLVVPVQGHA